MTRAEKLYEILKAQGKHGDTLEFMDVGCPADIMDWPNIGSAECEELVRDCFKCWMSEYEPLPDDISAGRIDANDVETGTIDADNIDPNRLMPTFGMLVDYGVAVECKNPDAWYTCYKCGMCGRVFENGFMISDGGTHVYEEEE